MSDNPQDTQPSDQLLPLDELMSLASIDEEDVAAAVEWWQTHASEPFKDVLDDDAT